MENNENIEEINLSEDLAEKRASSKKFMKIYMATLAFVVIGLIALSVSSQNKLEDRIQELNTEMETTEKEALSAMDRVEKLQILSENQTKLLSENEKTIADLTKKVEELEKNEQLNTINMQFLNFKNAILRTDYTNITQMIEELENNIEQLSQDMIDEYENIKANLFENGIIEIKETIAVVTE